MPETLESYALIALDDVKESLGISDASKDNILTRYINYATDLIEKYCNNRRFKETTYTDEEVNGSGTHYLNLKHFPVTSITKLEYRTSSDYSASDFDQVDTSDYILESSDSGMIYFPRGFVRGTRNYRVTYIAGYATIPHDLEEACGQLVSYLYKNAGKTEGIKSETLGRYSVTYDKDSSADLFKKAGVFDILQFYRMITV